MYLHSILNMLEIVTYILKYLYVKVSAMQFFETVKKAVTNNTLRGRPEMALVHVIT
jgi:hypothetical protein